jgi:hypothetical protein
MKKHYLVSLDLQEDAIAALCLRSCKRILVGVIEIQGMEFMPCPEKKCPHIDTVLNEPTLVNHRGVNYHLRKLKNGPY